MRLHARLAQTAAAALLLAVAGPGCSRGDPLDSRIDASSEVSLQMWEARQSGELTAEQMQQFKDALQELRFERMSKGVSGSDAIEQEVHEAINGRSFREIVATGYGLRVNRLDSERQTLEANVAYNATIRTNPGDEASRRYVEHASETTERRLEEVREQERDAKEVLARFAAAASPAPASQRKDP